MNDFSFLNPNNARELRRKYDIVGGYENYHRRCQEQCQRAPEGFCDGLEKVSVLTPEQAGKIRGLIDEDSDKLRDHDFRVWLLESILEPLDGKLLAYFRSEYCPLWMRFYKNEPDNPPEESYSFYWHCDGGPTAHLKLLLYLSSTEECGGNTAFIPSLLSWNLEEAGYTFCPMENRTVDLEPLCEELGLHYQEQRFDIQSGEGVLFEPAQILHKGIWPTEAPRYLVQICFLPCGIPWRDACARHSMPVESNAWPDVSKAA